MGLSTWTETKIAPANASGPPRGPPRCTAATSKPIPIAKAAGRIPLSRRIVHQAPARPGSAFGRTPKNFHSLRSVSDRSKTASPSELPYDAQYHHHRETRSTYQRGTGEPEHELLAGISVLPFGCGPIYRHLSTLAIFCSIFEAPSRTPPRQLPSIVQIGFASPTRLAAVGLHAPQLYQPLP